MIAETADAATEGLPWVSIIGGIIGGAATVGITHLLFQIPKVRVRSRRNLQWNNRTGKILSNQGSVRVANVRGRPVQIDQVALMEKGQLTNLSEWDSQLPKMLQEGGVVELEFDDNAVIRGLKHIRPVAKDSLDRYWPRHRRFVLWLWRWWFVYPVISRRIRQGGVPTEQDLEDLSAKMRDRHEKRTSSED